MQYMRNILELTGIRAGIRRAAIVVLSGLGVVLLASAAEATVSIQEIRSESGVTAWLVEDYALPMVTIRFAFEGGSTQDPAGKEGLARLMTGLFDEGAGELDRDAFQTRLDDAGAEMRFGAGRDTVYGTVRLLSDNMEEALELVRLAIQQPRFDPEPIERIRAQMLSGIEAAARDPQTMAEFAWAEAVYGNHPYSRRSEGTEQSLAAITAEDLRALHGDVFARDGLHVALVGAIDAATARREIDRLFGRLPAEQKLTPIDDVQPNPGQLVRIDYPLPQTTIRLAYPAVPRDSPDFYAAYLMNHILGGGTLSSRLFDEVREKRGLAYGVGSSLVTSEHASMLVIGTSTRSDRADEALEVIREQVSRMAQSGPTEEELAAAKKYVVGSYALSNLDSSRAIAATLVALQLEALGIDYIDRREGLIQAVTLEEVAASARALLSAEPVVMIVGPQQADAPESKPDPGRSE